MRHGRRNDDGLDSFEAGFTIAAPRLAEGFTAGKYSYDFTQPLREEVHRVFAVSKRPAMAMASGKIVAGSGTLAVLAAEPCDAVRPKFSRQAV